MRYPLPAGPRHQTPRKIIVHAMGEFINNKPAWEFLESIGLSAHAFITPSGVVVRSRKDTQGAWHAKGFNTDSLGIEFLVPGEFNPPHGYSKFKNIMNHPNSTESWITDAQFFAGAEVVAEWCYTYCIEPHQNIRRHSDIDPDRKIDPGIGFPWDKFIQRVEDSIYELASST